MDSQFIYLWSMRCININWDLIGFDNQFVDSRSAGSVIIGLAVSQCQELTDQALLA